MPFTPTAEQVDAFDVFATGDDLVLEAGAGTGKTSTLKLLGESVSDKGVYIAYNKAIADEAKGRFPTNVKCATAHSFAYAAVGHKYRARLDAERKPPWKVAKLLRIDGSLAAGERILNESTLARLTMEMVGNFCNSADPTLTLSHRPYVEGLVGTRINPFTGQQEPHDYHRDLAALLLPFAEKVWEDLQKTSGEFAFSHDHYLKLWQLSSPKLNTQFVLFDEAQDANPVIADIVAKQDSQRVYVGDRAQAIYGWRGAVDAMDIPGVQRRFLSQSFRFGPAIADAANQYLTLLDTPLRLTGTDAVSSRLERGGPARAVLCRTNAGALQVLIDAQTAGGRPFLVGGASEILSFCKGAIDLQNGRKAWHRDLIAFSSWDEVREHAREERGTLRTWVTILDTHTPQAVQTAMNAMPAREAQADLVVSTAHKAKGREWESVRIHQDFDSNDAEGEPTKLSDPDVMLRYVAVTRAMNVLDPGPLDIYAPIAVPSAVDINH